MVGQLRKGRFVLHRIISGLHQGGQRAGTAHGHGHGGIYGQESERAQGKIPLHHRVGDELRQIDGHLSLPWA